MTDKLSSLRLFLSTMELASISQAARRHGMSTTSASRRLMDLEADLGVRLLERTTRYVAPTEAGRRFRDRIAPLTAGLDNALREAAEDVDVPSGELRVLARRSFAMTHIAPLLPDFCARNPQVVVDLQLTETVEIAPGDDIDVAIRLGAPASKTAASAVLASGRRILAASPDYLRRTGAPERVEDLSAHACLSYRRGDAAPVWVFETGEGRREIAVSGPLRASNGELLRDAALAGLGFVLLPAWMIAGDVKTGRLVACLSDSVAWPAGFDREIVATYRRADPPPAKVAAFLAHIVGRDYEGEI